MTSRRLLNAVAIFLMSMLLMPLDTQAQVRLGDYDCGEWFAPAKRPSAEGWLLGYLSGMNYAYAGTKQEVLEKLNTGHQAVLWVDNYCKANPLRFVSDAARELHRELLGKQ